MKGGGGADASGAEEGGADDLLARSRVPIAMWVSGLGAVELGSELTAAWDRISTTATQESAAARSSLG